VQINQAYTIQHIGRGTQPRRHCCGSGQTY